MKHLRKEQGSAHVIIIVVLIVVILGLLGFVFWQNFMAKKDTPQANTTSKTDTSSNATTPVSDIKTYQSSPAGISLQYPSSWTLSEEGSDPNIVATITSPDTASKKSSSPDATNYDVVIQAVPTSGSTNSSTPAGVLALTSGNAAEYASMKYTETINSINVTEYDMNAQTPYFAAIFPIGSNYVELDFIAATKADMTTALTKILQSVQKL